MTVKRAPIKKVWNIALLPTGKDSKGLVMGEVTNTRSPYRNTFVADEKGLRFDYSLSVTGNVRRQVSKMVKDEFIRQGVR
jgi:hypothetical protein